MLKKEYKELIKKMNQAKKYEEVKEILDSFHKDMFEEGKIKEFTSIMIKKYRKISSNIYPFIIQYFYEKNSKLEFNIACELLQNHYCDIPYITNLESIPISEEKFLDFLPTLLKIIKENASGIADCMYLILLGHEESYDKITEEQKKVIMESLYKINIAMDYIEQMENEPTLDLLKSIEIMVDVAKRYCNVNILKYVERTLNLDVLEINLFAVNTLLYNNVPVLDSYIDELGQKLETCKRFHRMLSRMEKLYRFPEKYANQEHFVLSDMYCWLTHPAELGEAPSHLEIAGKFEWREETFYICKFQSSKEGMKQKGWMVGVSGGYHILEEPSFPTSGYTFSDFEELDEENAIEQCKKLISKIDQALEEKCESMKK